MVQVCGSQWLRRAVALGNAIAAMLMALGKSSKFDSARPGVNHAWLDSGSIILRVNFISGSITLGIYLHNVFIVDTTPPRNSALSVVGVILPFQKIILPADGGEGEA